MLILVRHALPDHGPDIPARDWHLSAEARRAAEELCARLPAGARLVASSEPKAIQTIEPAGPVVQDSRFDEIERVEEYDDDFRTRRLAYVEGADHEDWEHRHHVVRRFADGLADHLRAGTDLVIASHGMAMTLWLTATVGLEDPGGFWAGLTFPDAYVVDPRAGTVIRF